MRVLLSILREFADLPEDPSAVEDAMNRLGMAVEASTIVGEPVPGVVSARIVRMERHPDAAKVTRCWVDAGDGEHLHVWCGATNMGVGDVVPLARVGTRMPDGREIGSRGILGVESQGMLCSGVELGLEDASDGLLLLPTDTPLGRDLFEVMGIERDVLYELDLTRNRPDCWGHLGVARDLAAHFGVAMNQAMLTVERGDSGVALDVRIKSGDRCGLFTVTHIEGVRVTASPPSMRRRLERLGMRSINNVVDASNLVMLELNQPNHAYDATRVRGFEIRLASEGEMLTTLDGKVRHLDRDDLVICDGSSGNAIGLAGVMGDATSEISASTTELMLECAWFAPDPIRFTAQRHALRTEASLRFERGVDPEGWSRCVGRFVELLRLTCPDARQTGSTTVVSTPELPGQRTARLRVDQVERLLGTRMEPARCGELLEPLGFRARTWADDTEVLIPSWRPDCVDEVDLIEEIARHHGYESLGRSVPRSPVHGRLSVVQARRRLLRRVLVGLGLDEAMPNPFLAPGDLTSAGLDEGSALAISNPLVSDESILRTSLRVGLLRAVRYNQSHRADRIGLWEIGHVYPRSKEQLPDEREQLAIVVAGAGTDEAMRQWAVISDQLAIGAQIDQSRVPPGLHPTRSATLARGKTVIGAIGEVSPVVLDRLGIEGRVSILELDLTRLLAEEAKPVQARPINRHPSSDIDLAFIVPDEIQAQALSRALRQAAGARLVELRLFDSYRGPGVDEGARSLAFRLRLQEPGATLTDAAISETVKACVEAASKLGVSIRA